VGDNLTNPFKGDNETRKIQLEYIIPIVGTQADIILLCEPVKNNLCLQEILGMRYNVSHRIKLINKYKRGD
jgi:hypothetical protein